MTDPPSSSPTGTAPDSDGAADATTAPEVPLLTQPADGVPPVADSPAALADVIAALAAGSGPVAVDAERAHGFRYSQRAYLIQLRREGSGTHLVDPVAFGTPADLSALGATIADAEWIIHAASQDLACLAEVGMLPTSLFDTELAGRLLGYPRVALGTLVEEKFSVRLLKEHSASDWSSRPLPQDWLVYAALDVELLIELRNELASELSDAGKLEWAEQEFAALAAGAAQVPEPRSDPWRRTSGLHQVRNRRGLALVRSLWLARNEIAQRLDKAPGKILTDKAITELAAMKAPDRSSLRQVPPFQRRQARRFEASWLEALAATTALSDSELPPLHVPSDGPPQARMWAAKDPEAAARLSRVREAVAAKAKYLDLPVENLLTPDYLRRLTWRPPEPVSEESVDRALAELGARQWQRDQTVAMITPLLAPVPA